MADEQGPFSANVVLGWLRTAPVRNARCYAVLAALACHADKNRGDCTVKQSTLAHLTRQPLRCVNRAISELVEDGLIEVEKRFGPMGRRVTSSYQLTARCWER